VPALPAGSTVSGALLGSGREADVYAAGPGRVRRRYRDGRDVTDEAAVMAYLHGLGYPVPEVYEAAGADLVMERVDGPTLLRALAAGEVGPREAGRLLADLHTRLHALPARTSTDPADRVLHLDLHPDNVILAARGPVVIDWVNTTEGPPDLDVALCALIMAEAASGSYVPPELAGPAAELLREYLARVGGDPVAYLDRAVARRSANPFLTREEVARLDAAAALVRSSAPAAGSSAAPAG